MLDIKEIDHLAKLAKIKLTNEEKQRFALEISSILEYVEKLQAVKTDGNLAEELKDSYLREDRVIGFPLSEQQELISQAPETTDNLIKTKAVFG